MTNRTKDGTADLTPPVDHRDLVDAVAAAIAGSVGISDTLQHAIDTLCDRLHFPVGHAYLIDLSGRKLSSSRVWPTKMAKPFDSFRERSELLTFWTGEEIVGRGAMSTTPIWVTDYSRRQFVRSRIAGDCGLHIGLTVPIAFECTPIGVLEFFGERLATEPVGMDMELLCCGQLIGEAIHRIAIEDAAIETRRIIDSRNEKLAAFGPVGHAIESNKLLCITFDLITTKTVIELNFYAAHILLLDIDDPASNVFALMSPIDSPLDFPSIRSKYDPARRAAVNCESVRIHDNQDLEPHEALPHTCRGTGSAPILRCR